MRCRFSLFGTGLTTSSKNNYTKRFLQNLPLMGCYALWHG